MAKLLFSLAHPAKTGRILEGKWIFNAILRELIEAYSK